VHLVPAADPAASTAAATATDVYWLALPSPAASIDDPVHWSVIPSQDRGKALQRPRSGKQWHFPRLHCTQRRPPS